MAPQGESPVAATVLGTIGTDFGVCKIWTNWRTKSTEGLPALMMFLWAICGVPFGAYDIIQNFNVPLQVQPQMFMALCLCSFTQILLYHHKIPVWKGALIGLTLACAFAGVEAALILTLRPKYQRGEEAPALVVGVIASILLGAGLLPPYFEIYKRHGRVIGINWVFLCMDWLGAFFSLMALVAQSTFDVLGGVIYIICALLEIGIFTSHIIWRLRTRSIRKQAQAEGKTFDQLGAEKMEAGEHWHWVDRTIPPVLSFTWWCRLVTGRRQTNEDDEEAATYVPDGADEQDGKRQDEEEEATCRDDEKYMGEGPSNSLGEIAPAPQVRLGHSTTGVEPIIAEASTSSRVEKGR